MAVRGFLGLRRIYGASDANPPTAILNPPKLKYDLKLHEEFTTPVLTLTDDVDGKSKPNPNINNVDTATPGAWQVVWSGLKDKAGNAIADVIVTVNVEVNVWLKSNPKIRYFIKLPFWLSDNVIERVKKSAESFWAKIQSFTEFQKNQTNALTAHQQLLWLMAWERDVKRLPNEPISFFRLRVKYAYVNARDAGSLNGLERIFMRLNIQIIDIKERQDQINWDVITILISDSQLNENGELISNIIKQYGRTCRRYELATFDITTVNIAVIEYCGSQEFTEVTYEPD